MGKPKGPRKPPKRMKSRLGSDDELENEPDPDPKSRSYVYDEIDEFHANKEKVLLDAGRHREEVDVSDEEDVYSLRLSSDSDDNLNVASKYDKSDMDSDLEEDVDDLPNMQAWGKRKAAYYNTDFVDKDYGGYGESDIEMAEAEEKEALALQQKMADQIDELDFGLDQFQVQKKEVESKRGTKVEKDFSKLSKQEKLNLLKTESPELINLLEDFNAKLLEMRDRIQPLFALVQSGELPSGAGADYIRVKFQLLLSYCTNVVFYTMLKAKRVPLTQHPIINRLVSYRKLMKELEPLDEKLAKDITAVLESIHAGGNVRDILANVGSQVQKRQRTKLKILLEHSKMDKKLEEAMADGAKPKKSTKLKKVHQMETEDEKNALKLYSMMKAGHKRTKGMLNETNMDDSDDMSEDGQAGSEDNQLSDGNHSSLSDSKEPDEPLGKRGITYQIAKNKGLTPYRKKEVRNPRVKNRMKYRKAKIRRKGQVRETRTEISKYGGEISGIRATTSRSIKLK